MALNTQRGEPARGLEGTGRAPLPRAPPCLEGPTWPPSTYHFTHALLLPPKKNPQPAQTRVLAHFAAIFDLLAQSTIHQTVWGDCSLVCDSSIGPISFCSSALFVANLCYCGDLFLSLHVKSSWSEVVLMHDIASRNL